MDLNKWFTHIAEVVSHATGHAAAFILCCTIVIIWAATGPVFAFSDTWQVDHQHWNDDRHLPYGLPNSEHAESRWSSDSSQT